MKIDVAGLRKAVKELDRARLYGYRIQALCISVADATGLDECLITIPCLDLQPVEVEEKLMLNVRMVVAEKLLREGYSL